MKNIIPPIDIAMLKSELKPELFLRKTNYGNREVYAFTHAQAPNLMLEVGRLREISFREAGGGTGKETDIDEFDIQEIAPYKQLIVWDVEAEKIVGGYRYLEGKQMDKFDNGVPRIATSELFHFSEKFLTEYLPKTIELGRSFVSPEYQSSSDARKGLFSLDNLWDGLGAIAMQDTGVEYYFGKITMYPSFNTKARDLILHYFKLYFPDKDNLVTPIYPVNTVTPLEELEAPFVGLKSEEAYKVLTRLVRELGENIPPMFSAYLKLSATMKTFGTAVNEHFGEVEETGILVRIPDVYPSKKERHMVW